MVFNINHLEYRHPVDNLFIKINYYISEKKIPILKWISSFVLNNLTNRILRNDTKLLFEISGLANFIDELERKDEELLITLLKEVLSTTEDCNNMLIKYPHGYKISELTEINKLLIEESERLIERIEDKIHKNYHLNLTFASISDDWNSPENDIWDTY